MTDNVLVHAQGCGQLCNQIGEDTGLHTGSTTGAGFFLICKNDHQGVLGLICCQNCGESGIGANTVIVTVAADHRAVEANVTALECGNDGQLCADKVGLYDAVLFVEQLQECQLDVLALCQRLRADEDVQLFAGDTLAHRTAHLILCKVGEQIVDVEYGIGLFLADDDVAVAAVGTDDSAVDGKRSCNPLVLLDTAVVMGLEEAHIALFIDGMLLQVDAGRVDMGCGDANAVFHRLAADHEQEQFLVAVVIIEFVTCLYGHTKGIGLKIASLCHLDGVKHCFSLGLAQIQIGLVALGIDVHFFFCLLVQCLVNVLTGVEKAISEFLDFFGCHYDSSVSFSYISLYFSTIPVTLVTYLSVSAYGI